MREGYHQIELHPDSQDITTFCNTQERQIYGVSSASQSFQKQIESVIAGCEGARNINDDILVWDDTEEQQTNVL